MSKPIPAPAPEAIAFALAQMDVLGVAACHIDGQDRLQAWNDSYLRIFPEHIGVVHAGWDYTENLRHYFEVNHGGSLDRQRLEDMVAGAVQRHRSQTGPLDFQKRDGCWLRSRLQRLADGGVIKSWSDVTAEVLHTEAAVVEALSTLQQALICYDSQGHFFFANNRASSFFPRLIEYFRAGADFASHLRLLAAEAAESRHAEALFALAAQAWPPQRGSAAPLLVRLRDGRLLQLDLVNTRKQGLTTVWTDVTEAHRLLAEQSRAEAEASAKSDFLAVMSHEIRTPLNGVLGALALLGTEAMAPADRNLIETAQHSAEHLLHLLNNILDYSKLEAGQAALALGDYDPRRLVDGVVQGLRHQAEAKGLYLDCRVAPDLPAVLHGDAGRLRQILYNLLDNAVKFTETGWVRLEAGLVPAVAGCPARLEFAVSDSGSGVPEAIRPQLFRHFTQADRSITRRHGGTGLGLAICGQLAALMQGEILIENRANSGTGRSGSVFRLRLPLQLAQDLPAATAPTGRALLLLPVPINVLVAEDNPTNQMILCTMLQQFGHRTNVAANGLQACEMVSRGSFDLVLMDMQMPEMDGLAAARAIRAMPEPWGSVPIVAVTANALADDRERCLAAGMNGFVTKPVEPGQLMTAIRVALAGRMVAGEALASVPAAAPVGAPVLSASATHALGALAEKLRRQTAAGS